MVRCEIEYGVNPDRKALCLVYDPIDNDHRIVGGLTTQQRPAQPEPPGAGGTATSRPQETNPAARGAEVQKIASGPYPPASFFAGAVSVSFEGYDPARGLMFRAFINYDAFRSDGFVVFLNEESNIKQFGENQNQRTNHIYEMQLVRVINRGNVEIGIRRVR